MNSTDSINREALLRLVNLVRPALSTQDYIPAFKTIRFADRYATAYNDILGIKIELPSSALSLGLCLPGEMLIKTLSSFNAESVMLQPSDKDGSLLITSGRSKIKLPTIPAKNFVFAEPDGKAPTFNLDDDMLTGIQLCLVGVSNDPTRPATQGVTLEVDGKGRAVLFSTDNATISMYRTRSKLKLPGDAPVIMPKLFCEQLVVLVKAFPKSNIELELHPGAIVGYVLDEDEKEKAVIFTKTVADLEPLDFLSIVAKHIKVEDLAEDVDEIPTTFDAAFERALLVLSSEVDKATKITFSKDGLRLHSTSALGEADDSIELDSKQMPAEGFHIDPSLVIRGCKSCTHLGFYSRVLALTNKNATFVHLISHSSV